MSVVSELTTLSTELDYNVSNIINGFEAVTLLKNSTEEDAKATLAYSLGKLSISYEEAKHYINNTLSTEGFGDIIKAIIANIKKFFKLIWENIKAIFSKILDYFNLKERKVNAVLEAGKFLEYMNAKGLIIEMDIYSTEAYETDQEFILDNVDPDIIDVIIKMLRKHKGVKGILNAIRDKNNNVYIINRGLIFRLTYGKPGKAITTNEIIEKLYEATGDKYYALIKLSMDREYNRVASSLLETLKTNAEKIVEATEDYINTTRTDASYNMYIGKLMGLNYQNDLYSILRSMLEDGEEIVCLSGINLEKNIIGMIVINRDNKMQEKNIELTKIEDIKRNYKELLSKFVSTNISEYIRELHKYLSQKEHHKKLFNNVYSMRSKLSNIIADMEKNNTPDTNKDIVLFRILLSFAKKYLLDMRGNVDTFTNFVEICIGIRNRNLLRIQNPQEFKKRR